ncbi:MAG: type II toxin-antitoxin system PemK/MazF family toxin [Chloroflexi bacterium]|nr:type II toxin-antitoxin system PemK/MazF family toxin [Chloroflexota bacterium]
MYVNLPPPIGGSGPEQAGRRPAILVLSDASATNNPMTMVVPITSQLSALRFPHTFRVEPSPVNGLTAPSAVLVFQLRAVGHGRLDRVIGRLEDNYLQTLDAEMRRMLGL